MKQPTISALNRINRRFYRRRALEFSETRSRPWPGWDRVIESIGRWSSLGPRGGVILEPPPAIDVVDAGCGNGRFASLLGERASAPFSYLGVDLSLELLGEARRRLTELPAVRDRYLVFDLVAAPRALAWSGAAAGLVVAFGLLHHVPGIASRRRLLRGLAEMLCPGGLLAVSFWQFGDRDRFRRRVVSWREHNARSDNFVDPAELEKGDYLLAWGDVGEADGSVRYCHFTDRREAVELVDALGLETIERFRSDGEGGDLNLYYVLRKPRSTASEGGSRSWVSA